MTPMPVTMGYRDLVLALRETGLVPASPVLAIGPQAIPEDLRGGSAAMLSALLAASAAVISPAFTFQTMVYPAVGPAENGIDYATVTAASEEAEFYQPGLPVSSALGPLAETVRRAPGAERSAHPILSFAGVRAGEFLKTQSLDNSLAPVDALARAGGDVILLGADHTANAALFLAEQHAGRKRFVRWALTADGVVECPMFPGCSKGFGAVADRLQGIEKAVVLDRPGFRPFRIARAPLRDLLHAASSWIRESPRALLCDEPGCPLCSAVRRSLAV